MLNPYDRCPAWTFFDPVTNQCIPVMSRTTVELPLKIPDDLKGKLPDTPELPTPETPDEAIVVEAAMRKGSQPFKKKLAIEKASRETV